MVPRPFMKHMQEWIQPAILAQDFSPRTPTVPFVQAFGSVVVRKASPEDILGMCHWNFGVPLMIICQRGPRVQNTYSMFPSGVLFRMILQDHGLRRTEIGMSCCPWTVAMPQHRVMDVL